MSRHLNAQKGEIAKYVLISGNPHRTKWAAEKYLENYKLVSDNRGENVYTGFYKGVKVSLATSGMGMPSITVYAHELINDYDVKVIIRTGTAGAYGKNLNVFDVFNPNKCYTESNIGEYLWDEESLKPDQELYELINDVGKKMQIPIKTGTVHSADLFYGGIEKAQEAHEKHQCEAVEMETRALWGVAKQFNIQAATLLIVSDLVLNKENKTVHETSFQERVEKCGIIFKLGLETFVAHHSQMKSN